MAAHEKRILGETDVPGAGSTAQRILCLETRPVSRREQAKPGTAGENPGSL